MQLLFGTCFAGYVFAVTPVRFRTPSLVRLHTLAILIDARVHRNAASRIKLMTSAFWGPRYTVRFRDSAISDAVCEAHRSRILKSMYGLRYKRFRWRHVQAPSHDLFACVQREKLERCILSDTVSERLRRWTRNPLGSARRGSNPLGVVLHFGTQQLEPSRRKTAVVSQPSADGR